MEQVRAIKIGLEQKIGAIIEAQSPILEWCLEHAGLLISRYKLGKDGKTPHRRLHGRESKAMAVEFGEQIWQNPSVIPKPLGSKA